MLKPKKLSQIAVAVREAELPIAEVLHPDEKCYKLAELVRLDTTSKHLRRWEFIYVQRDGQMAVHIEDMGPADATPELQVISVWEDSVSYCREEANRMRYENALAKFFEERKGEMEKFIEVWANWRSELYLQKKNRSTLGPKFNRQRNEFVRGH